MPPPDLKKRFTIPWKLFAFVVVAISVALAWYAYSCGLLLTHDSRHYLAAAKSFKNSFQFAGVNGSDYTYWPPLFPVLLSVFPNPEAGLMWVNVVLKIILFFMLIELATRILARIESVFAYLLFVFCGVHLTLISVFVWSELIFLVLLVGFIISIGSYQKSKRHQVLAMILGFLLCLQRNAGLFIISGTALWMFLSSTEGSWAGRLKTASLLFIMSTSGLWAWNIYVSFFTESDFRFYDHSFFQSTMYNFTFMAQSLQKAFVPFIGGARVGFILVFGVTIYQLRNKFGNKSLQALLFWIVSAYFAGMVFMFQFDMHDGDRYLSVILPLFTLLVLSCAEELINVQKKWVKIASICVLLAGLVYPISRSVKNVILWHEMGCSRVVATNSFYE